MSVRLRICFRCADQSEAFCSARADARENRNSVNHRKCSKKRIPVWMMTGSSALNAEHVLTGATQLV